MVREELSNEEVELRDAAEGSETNVRQRARYRRLSRQRSDKLSAAQWHRGVLSKQEVFARYLRNFHQRREECTRHPELEASRLLSNKRRAETMERKRGFGKGKR